MIELKLKDHADAEHEINLPAPIPELMRHPNHFTLTGELLALHFHTPDPELNAGLKACLLPLPANCSKELHLLGYLLDRMEERHRCVLRDHLPVAPCMVSEIIQRSVYICDHLFWRDGTVNDYARPLKECSPFVDEHNLDEFLQREFRTHLEQFRLTGGQLFEKTVECARESGDMAHFDTIHEYVLPESDDKAKITNYDFSIVPIVNYGCEGIYIDCGVKGGFDEGKERWLSVGTIKTLKEDLDAAKIMGELCGVLLHHGSQYVNTNLWRFMPTEEIEHSIARKLERQQAQEQGMHLCM